MSIEAKVNAFKAQLIRLLSEDEAICGIGQTGDVNAPLIPGKSDIDLFVICQAVPEKELRRKRYEKLAGDFDRLEIEVCAGGIWGCGDIFHVEGDRRHANVFHTGRDESLSGRGAGRQKSGKGRKILSDWKTCKH